MHTDPILCLDGAATTLLTIQYNLCIGTIAPFALKRPELVPLLRSLLKYETMYVAKVTYFVPRTECRSGQFCLTEIGHGLDAFNLGTTATRLPSGEFDLHTPTPNNAK